ncbi:MAG: DUF1501 domain-containing protein [Planctomycetia bacterium]|nr:DUF1501 domain-containing protein [Planctomycetia bacterium]
MHRREFLGMCCGATAASLGFRPALSLAAEEHGGHPLVPRQSHHEARAKNLLFIFLTGGFSHVDTFDHKPKLKEDSGKIVNSVSLRTAEKQPLLGSPFAFRQCGQSGLWISDLFPGLASVADELCVIRTLHTDIVEHFQAVLAMHTGSATVPLPGIGAWLSYGLGSDNGNLPGYMVLCEHLPYAGAQSWDSNFLPPVHQGVRIVPGNDPIPNLKSPINQDNLTELEQLLLKDANELHAAARAGDRQLAARTSSFHVARGMMKSAPEAFDLARETAGTLAAYGAASGDKTSFAAQCLTARRLIERGVRTVEIFDSGASNNWDSHSNMQDHRPKAQRVDRPLAALIADLRQRGLLDETLVAICTEFGRTPWTDAPGTLGRNHYAKAFSSLLCGAGVRGGSTYGQTDDYGISIVEKPCHVHDYHATILHLLGLDHKRLTYRYAGRDFRLTDVHGQVLTEILA